MDRSAWEDSLSLPLAQQLKAGQGTPQSVGLLQTSDQLVADTTQHLQQVDIHASGGIRTHNATKRSVADPRLRQLCHWDRHKRD